MQSHGSGPVRGTRQASYSSNHSWLVSITGTLFPSVLGTPQKFVTVDGTTQNPVAYRTRYFVETSISGGTVSAATLNIGTTSGGTEILTASVFGVAANTVIAPSGIAEIKVANTATDLFANVVLTGAGPTAGRIWVMIEMWDLNLVFPTAQGD